MFPPFIPSREIARLVEWDYYPEIRSDERRQEREMREDGLRPALARSSAVPGKDWGRSWSVRVDVSRACPAATSGRGRVSKRIRPLGDASDKS